MPTYTQAIIPLAYLHVQFFRGSDTVGELSKTCRQLA
jgi:hypothetical protein